MILKMRCKALLKNSLGWQKGKPPTMVAKAEAIYNMACNSRGTLIKLLRKEQTGLNLTTPEWGFLAQMSYETYDSAYHQIDTISRDLLIANLSAFAAVLKLRDDLYPSLGKADGIGYYLSNLGFSWVDRSASGNNIYTHLNACIEGMPSSPSSGCAVFSCRNLDVLLRDAPPLPADRLNQVLRPYLKALLLVCTYGYWGKNSEALLTNKHRPDGRKKSRDELTMENFVTLKSTENAYFHISPIATETTIGILISVNLRGFAFALNDYAELTGFQSMLLQAGTKGNRARISEFEIFTIQSQAKNALPVYQLACGRWRHSFTSDEFEALKELLSQFFAIPAVAAHLQKLELIYGRI